MNIDKLKELEAKATRGPWQVMPPENDKPYLRIRGTRLGYRYKITNVHDVIYEGVHERERQETESNADLLATLRNLAPHLIALWEAAKQMRDSGNLEQAYGTDRPVLAALAALENA